TRRSSDLVAEGGDGFAGTVEVAHDVQDLGVEAQILRRTPAGNDEGVVVLGVNFIKSSVQREIVASLFAVSLVAFKVVNSGADLLSLLLAGANRVDLRS